MNSIDILEEKEKKAIEILHNWLCDEHSKFCRVGAVGIPNEEFFATEIVLNLVKNLIAENKELKDSNVELATTIDCLQTDLKEINEEYNAEQKDEMENTIPKSKVEMKIHDIDNWLEGGRYIHYGLNPYELEAQKKVLQSLLGKE